MQTLWNLEFHTFQIKMSNMIEALTWYKCWSKEWTSELFLVYDFKLSPLCLNQVLLNHVTCTSLASI